MRDKIMGPEEFTTETPRARRKENKGIFLTAKILNGR